MQLALGPHLEESELEKYSMGKLEEALLPAFEEHLIACVSCQDRLLEMEAFVNAVRSVSPALREAPPPDWRRLFVWPRLAWAGAVAMSLAALTVGVIRLQVPRGQAIATAVFLQSSRGVEGLTLASAPAGRPVLLNIDLTELPTLPSYRLEIVDTAGKSVWESVAAPRDGRLAQPVTKDLAAGRYYVRLYSPDAELLREFGLRLNNLGKE